MLRQGVPSGRAVRSQDMSLEGAAAVGFLDATDALAAFHSEADWPQEAPVSPPRASRPVAVLTRSAAVSLPARLDQQRAPSRWVVFLLAAVAIAEAPFAAMWIQDRTATTRSNGTVYVETEPSGAEVWINGETAGRTPTRLSIPRGAAEIQLRHAGSVRVLPLTVVPEEIVRLRVDLPSAGQSVALPGSTPTAPTDAP